MGMPQQQPPLPQQQGWNAPMDPQMQMMQTQNEIAQLQQQIDKMSHPQGGFGSPPPPGNAGGFDESDSDSENDWWHAPALSAAPPNASQFGSMPGLPNTGMGQAGPPQQPYNSAPPQQQPWGNAPP